MPRQNIRAIVVKSSNVEWVGYPTTGEPMMIVQFIGGGRYGYLGVSRQRVVAAADAKSTGKYLSKEILPNYEVMRLTRD